ncbi:LOW QUALITY PROTEIN: hypothetical protein PanWU01x14_123890 [Parasponia andersonii]|uniref:Uncharacterized protein n=1 Tax=Parasponia andersonii TaxID=3476 RepID=A0A2P5CTX9_PARAD|nr:LOW QUALITY PROTEIN: hypothetical protein PanWU01x14_123890 [Parasponia andersonii]
MFILGIANIELFKERERFCYRTQISILQRLDFGAIQRPQFLHFGAQNFQTQDWKTPPIGDIECFELQPRFNSTKKAIDVTPERTEVDRSEPGESSKKLGENENRRMRDSEGRDQLIGDREEELGD